jgi:ABC-type bacteriocin/lantibiotic exporter with double-glycine peptidase domain
MKKTPYQRFWSLLKPDNKEIYQVYTYAFFKGIIALSLPIGIQSIINLIQGGSISASWLLLVFIVVIGIAMGGYMQLMQMRIMETIQQKIFARAAFDFTYRIPKIKFKEIYNYYAPELVNRFFDVVTIQKSLSKIIIDFSSAVLQITFGLILLSLYHPFFILFSFLLIILVFAIIKITSKRGIETSMSESKYKFKLVSWLEELARAKDSFRLAGLSKLPSAKTDERVVGYLNSRENHFQILRIQFILLLIFKIIVALGLLIAGGLLVIEQQMNIGQFVAAEIIILLIIDSSEKIILNLENVFDIFTSLEKLGEVTDLEIDDYDSKSSLQTLITNPITVELKNVSFTYPGRSKSVLNNINYTFDQNKKYCITGKNGSGKSTLLHLINGLYNAQSGSICFNGFPIGNYYINDIYKVVGSGLSEEAIFEGTLFENISLGREHVSAEDVLWAVEKILLHDFLKSLPKGLDTQIDITGQKLPRSIVQRIVLARSIVNKPKLLILEKNIDNIEELERNKIIDFLTDKNNEWTLICASNNSYFHEKSDVVINMSEGEFVTK